MRQPVLAVLASFALIAAPAAAWAGQTVDPALGFVEGPLQVPTLRAQKVQTPGDAGEPLFGQRSQVPIFRGDIGGSLDKYMRPAYRAVEDATDHLYDFVRVHVIDTVLPRGMSRGLSPSPQTDSYDAFRKALRTKEDRLAHQMLETYPAGVTNNGYYTASQLEQWQNWAAEQQVSVFVDSFRDAIFQRHHLQRFGRDSGDYLKDSDNWSPGFAAMSTLIGGAFLYLNGLHVDAHAGDIRLGIDLRAAARIRTAIAARGDPYQLGGLELGWKDKPIVLAAYWGMQNGHLTADQLGLNYRLRY